MIELVHEQHSFRSLDRSASDDATFDSTGEKLFCAQKHADFLLNGRDPSADPHQQGRTLTAEPTRPSAAARYCRGPVYLLTFVLVLELLTSSKRQSFRTWDSRAASNAIMRAGTHLGSDEHSLRKPCSILTSIVWLAQSRSYQTTWTSDGSRPQCNRPSRLWSSSDIGPLCLCLCEKSPCAGGASYQVP